MDENYLVPLIKFLPNIFLGTIFIFGLYKYYLLNKKQFEDKEVVSQKLFKKLIITSVFFKFLYSLSLTISQYFIWKKNPFSSIFLDLKLNKIAGTFLNYLPSFFEKKGGYFIYYSFFRFWLEFLIAVFLAFMFFLFLEALRKKNERFLNKSDSLLALWCTLMSGWPYFIIFLLVFALVFIFYGLWGKIQKKTYIPITNPLWISGCVSIFLGSLIIKTLNLNFLILFNL